MLINLVPLFGDLSWGLAIPSSSNASYRSIMIKSTSPFFSTYRPEGLGDNISNGLLGEVQIFYSSITVYATFFFFDENVSDKLVNQFTKI